MSPEARASGFFLRWSRHLRGHERPRPSRWVAVSCGLCRLTPLLRSEADVALPEFFSLILSLSGDQGPHLGGRPACLTRPPLATCHAHGPEASGPVPASAGLPIKTAEARRTGAEGPGSGSPNAGGCWLESRPSPDAHRRPPATTRRRARCGHDRHSGRPASAGLRPGPRLREAPVWEARGAGGVRSSATTVSLPATSRQDCSYFTRVPGTQTSAPTLPVHERHARVREVRARSGGTTACD